MGTRTAPQNSGKFQVKSDNDDRRRRQRIDSASIGYLLPESANMRDEPWEVRVHDLSRLGVGFVSSQPMEAGSYCRIRIGNGPMRLARRMRVTNCRPEAQNLFRIGAEFA
jgi:hypothetical protein